MQSVLSASQGLSQVSTVATHTALTVWAAAASFIVLIILTLFFYGFARYRGRGPYVALLLAFYTGYAVYLAIPQAYVSYLPSAPALTAVVVHALLYLAFVFVFYIILRRVVVSDFIYIGLFGLLGISFLAGAFLIALAYHAFSIASVYHFNNSIANLFAPSRYFFWWFVAPAIALFFLAH